jgi:hypothetical protein
MSSLNRHAHFQSGLAVLLITIFAAFRASAAVPYFDPFENQTANGGTTYAVGSSLAGQMCAGNLWVSIGSDNQSSAEPLIAGGNLSYPNLPAPAGNSISFFSSAGRSARLNLNALVNN